MRPLVCLHVVWFLVLACGESHAPAQHQAESVDDHQKPERVAVEATPAEVTPVELAPRPKSLDDLKAASPLPPPQVATEVVVEAKPRATRVQVGTGRCRVDDDCVLTGYREGCCAPSCESYAINKRDLTARQAGESCAAYRSGDKLCPPPAPCPESTTRALAARCVNRTCAALLESLTD